MFVRAGNKGPLSLCLLSSQSYPLETQMRWNNLFKTLQWLPTSLGVKAKFLRVTNMIWLCVSSLLSSPPLSFWLPLLQLLESPLCPQALQIHPCLRTFVWAVTSSWMRCPFTSTAHSLAALSFCPHPTLFNLWAAAIIAGPATLPPAQSSLPFIFFKALNPVGLTSCLLSVPCLVLTCPVHSCIPST